MDYGIESDVSPKEPAEAGTNKIIRFVHQSEGEACRGQACVPTWRTRGGIGHEANAVIDTSL